MEITIKAILILAFVTSAGCSRNTSIAVPKSVPNQTEITNIATLDCADSRLAPFNANLAKLTTISTPTEIESLFGNSDNIPNMVSFGFESVHTLTNGGKIRIFALPSSVTGRWKTTARYVPKDVLATKLEIGLKQEEPQQKKVVSPETALEAARAHLKTKKADLSRHDMTKPEGIQEVQIQDQKAWRVSWRLKDFTGKGGQLIVIVAESGECDQGWGE